MQLWQVREKHTKDVKEAMQAAGCFDSKGRVRAWNRRASEGIEQKGHTTVTFDSCRCKHAYMRALELKQVVMNALRGRVLDGNKQLKVGCA